MVIGHHTAGQSLEPEILQNFIFLIFLLSIFLELLILIYNEK